MQTAENNREAALAALEERRTKNKDIVRVDNTKLYAGDPMFFYCPGCNAEIEVPEDYIDKPEYCPDCTKLRELGWL